MWLWNIGIETFCRGVKTGIKDEHVWKVCVDPNGLGHTIISIDLSEPFDLLESFGKDPGTSPSDPYENYRGYLTTFRIIQVRPLGGMGILPIK